MENLPSELISIILKFIPIRKVIKLRSVSKKWKELIDFNLKNLESITIKGA